MAISIFSGDEKSEVFAKYLNESLFEVIYNLLGNLSPNKIGYSMAELWRDAKDIAMKVLTSKRDRTMFDFMTSNFNSGLIKAFGKNPTELFLNVEGVDETANSRFEIGRNIDYCIRAIILCHYYFVQPDKLQTTKIPFNGLDKVKEALENGEIVHDYDYACGCGLDDNASHASDGPIPLDKAVDIIERAQKRFPGGSIAFSQVDKVYDQLIEEAKDNENVNTANVATDEEVKPENEARVEEVKAGKADGKKKIDDLLQDVVLKEKLKPMFSDENDIPTFLRFVAVEKKCTLITQKVTDMVRAHKIIPEYAKGDLYAVLYDAGLYNKSKSNWNAQVKI